MKSARIRTLAALAMITLAASTFLAPASLAETAKSTVSKGELKVLLRTAKSPSDHQKIADYYVAEAVRLNATSKQHAALAEIYAKNPPFPAMELKHGSLSIESAGHCRRMAELDAEEAKEANALAALHQGMVRAPESKQP